MGARRDRQRYCIEIAVGMGYNTATLSITGGVHEATPFFPQRRTESGAEFCLYHPVGRPFADAAHRIPLGFTSASATCVTGLVLYDTWTQFTLFGQVVILLLIQVGGLSFMTVTIFISMLLGRRIGLHSRAVLMDTVGALQMAGIVRLTRRILKVTAVCEGLGALALLFLSLIHI